jgi:hypothetical protein
LSSSARPPEGDFAGFVGAALQALSAHQPGAYLALCQRMVGRRVRVTVDGESVLLDFRGGRVDLRAEDAPADVRIATARAVILEVLDGGVTLGEAVTAGRLHVRGEAVSLLHGLDALRLFVHGAVRSPSFPELLRRFRASADGAPRGADVSAWP